MRRPVPSSVPLDLRVLDLRRLRAEPTCCRILAKLSAEVIEIEAPRGVDPNEGSGLGSKPTLTTSCSKSAYTIVAMLAANVSLRPGAV